MQDEPTFIVEESETGLHIRNASGVEIGWETGRDRDTVHLEILADYAPQAAAIQDAVENYLHPTIRFLGVLDHRH